MIFIFAKTFNWQGDAENENLLTLTNVRCTSGSPMSPMRYVKTNYIHLKSNREEIVPE